MKTTLTGLLAAIAFATQTIFQQGHSVEDWKTWIFPFAIAIFGYLAKDATPPAP